MYPIINQKKIETSQPVANFAKKERVELTPEEQRNIQIPPLYYWEDVNLDGTSSLMTMAFQWEGKIYGMSYPIGADEQNRVRINIMRQKLFNVVKETCDVLVHHGMKVLDQYGNVDPQKVNDQEAIRYRFDPTWDRKVKAFNQLVKIYPITRKKAIKLGLIKG